VGFPGWCLFTASVCLGFMWSRYHFEVVVGEVEPQPSPNARGSAALAPQARAFVLDQIMMWLAVASLTVAFASFLRDVLAG
jgi:hypothetical protein